MSSNEKDNLPGTVAGSGTTGSRTSSGRARASVTLREGSGQQQSLADLMDPANKSLTDALKIAYRLLQIAIVCLVLLYLSSGLQIIQENQRGLRLTFGQIIEKNLPSGLRMSWPSPIGDLLRIDMSEQSQAINNAFFPALTNEEELTLRDPAKREQGLKGGTPNLDPDRDGQLLTSDGSIVHTRWKVTFKRSEDGKSLSNIAEKTLGDAETPESQIVTAAVRRGVIRAAASMTIDEVLYNQPDASRAPGTFRSVSELAKAEAQRFLDDMDCGIQLQQVSITDKMPPRSIIEAFNQVQSAQAEASKMVDESRGLARQALSETAGEAAPSVLTLIDRYEADIAKSDAGAAEKTLETLHDLMLRKSVSIDGKPVSVTISGKVAQSVADAQQYRTSIVAQSQSTAEVYLAKLKAYRSNPQVFLATEWNAAMKTFMTHPSVQTMVLPADVARTVITINKDPELAKALEQKKLEREGQEARIKRQRDAARDRFEGSRTTGQ